MCSRCFLVLKAAAQWGDVILLSSPYPLNHHIHIANDLVMFIFMIIISLINGGEEIYKSQMY